MSNDETAQAIHANVQRLLDQRKMPVRQLSQATGDPHMTIVNAISGVHVPNSAILARIAEALGVTPNDLIYGPRKKSRRTA